MILALLMACSPEAQPESISLAREFYHWTCSDYEDHSEIIVASETCEDRESGLWYLVAESYLYKGPSLKRRLTQEVPCYYETNFILIDEVCIELEGVALTAWVDPATWSGSLAGE